MTLATRCAACGTAFRVVQDQLKVANGWVRCGRCAHVFDANDALFAPESPGAIAGRGQGPVPASADTAVLSPPSAVDVPTIATAGLAASEPTAATPAALQPVERDGPTPADPPSPPVPPTPGLPQEASAEPPPGPPRWLLATPVTEQPVVDIGIGSVAPSTVSAVVDDAPVHDDGEPDFVDARFNEDLLAGLPGLRDPDQDAVDAASAPWAPGSAGPASAATGQADALRAVTHSDDVRRQASDRPSEHAPDDDLDHALSIDTPSAVPADAPVSTQAVEALPATADTALAVDEDAPAFLRQPRGDSRRWRRGPVRAALVAGAALLLLALGLQAALHWRDWLATRWPGTAPWLAMACAPTGCRVQPLRRLEDLGVDSTSLAPTSADSPALRLSVVLANRGELPLAAPNIELALTDATGELVARKVLTPSDFHSTVDVLKAGATVRWQTVLLATGEHVAGYTVELFYP